MLLRLSCFRPRCQNSRPCCYTPTLLLFILLLAESHGSLLTWWLVDDGMASYILYTFSYRHVSSYTSSGERENVFYRPIGPYKNVAIPKCPRNDRSCSIAPPFKELICVLCPVIYGARKQFLLNREAMHIIEPNNNQQPPSPTWYKTAFIFVLFFCFFEWMNIRIFNV